MDQERNVRFLFIEIRQARCATLFALVSSAGNLLRKYCVSKSSYPLNYDP